PIPQPAPPAAVPAEKLPAVAAGKPVAKDVAVADPPPVAAPREMPIEHPAMAAPPPRPAAPETTQQAAAEAPAANVHEVESDAHVVPGRHGADAIAEKPHGPVRLTGAEFDRITVRDGDSFAQIAVRKYGQSSYAILDLLKLANPSVEDINRISAGQTLD